MIRVSRRSRIRLDPRWCHKPARARSSPFGSDTSTRSAPASRTNLSRACCASLRCAKDRCASTSAESVGETMTSHPGLFAAASTTSAIGRDSGSSPVQVSRTRRLPMTVPWSGSTRGVLASLRVGATRRRNPPRPTSSALLGGANWSLCLLTVEHRPAPLCKWTIEAAREEAVPRRAIGSAAGSGHLAVVEGLLGRNGAGTLGASG